MKKKNQYKMKTKHLITMMTILCLGLIVLSLSTSFSFAPVRNVLGYVIVPFQNGINEVGNWMTDQKNGFQSMKKLSAENEKLQKQVDELQAKNTTLSQDQEELDRLRTLYNLDTDYSEFEKVAAQVIGKDTGNWYSTFLINRGSSDGIAVDMNVIADGGLVGIVTETGAHWATVRSIIDDSSNVSATVTSISQNHLPHNMLFLRCQHMRKFCLTCRRLPDPLCYFIDQLLSGLLFQCLLIRHRFSGGQGIFHIIQKTIKNHIFFIHKAHKLLHQK